MRMKATCKNGEESRSQVFSSWLESLNQPELLVLELKKSLLLVGHHPQVASAHSRYSSEKYEELMADRCIIGHG